MKEKIQTIENCQQCPYEISMLLNEEQECMITGYKNDKTYNDRGAYYSSKNMYAECPLAGTMAHVGNWRYWPERE